jgi:hypothetical protein
MLTANNGTYFIRDENDNQLCEYIHTLKEAKLIAASKDMYEALKALINWLGTDNKFEQAGKRI